MFPQMDSVAQCWFIKHLPLLGILGNIWKSNIFLFVSSFFLVEPNSKGFDVGYAKGGQMADDNTFKNLGHD